ncbi:sialate O-acetylesterase, partial [bacterium BMS3Abin03]|nr:sialate O-acetylesterase [bacterium BMS3Abin03]
MFLKISRWIFLFFLFISFSGFCQVKLPKLISDGMVLQRDAKVKIWGWASGGEKITIQFIGTTYNTTANKNDEWEVVLSNLKAGGPYVMKIDANNSITINDILVGDVWVCSGQSNMQLMLGWLSNVYLDEIDNSENHFIRQFF